MKSFKLIFSCLAYLFLSCSMMLSASNEFDSETSYIEAYLEDGRVLDPDLKNDWCALLVLKSQNGDVEIPIRREWRHQSQAEQDIERLKLEFSNQMLKVYLEVTLERDNFMMPDYIPADEPSDYVFNIVVVNSEGTRIDGFSEKFIFTDSFEIESYPQVLSCEKICEEISEGWFWNTYYATYQLELSDGTIWKVEESREWNQDEQEPLKDNVSSQLCVGYHVMPFRFRDDLIIVSLGSQECPKKAFWANDKYYQLVKVTPGT